VKKEGIIKKRKGGGRIGMRITGFIEDDEGNGQYLLEWRDSEGGKRMMLYSEAERSSKPVSPDEAGMLFENGDLETCSFAASEILFPEELEEIVGSVENIRNEEADA
jgi:hypothetical protein